MTKYLTFEEMQQELCKMAREAAEEAYRRMCDRPFDGAVYLWFKKAEPGKWGALHVSVSSPMNSRDGWWECLGQFQRSHTLEMMAAWAREQLKGLSILGVDREGVLPRS